MRSYFAAEFGDIVSSMGAPKELRYDPTYSIVCLTGKLTRPVAAHFLSSVVMGSQAAKVGTWLARENGVGGLVGTYLGGEWATRRAANNEQLQLKAAAVMMGGAGVLSTFDYVPGNVALAFLLIGCSVFLFYATTGPMNATIQGLVPERMRAMAIALIYLLANLIGMGLGPLIAGVMSDSFRSWAGEESLRYALLTLALDTSGPHGMRVG